MHIICPHCTTSYAINPATLGAAGRTVRCSRCKETWLARPEDAIEMAEAMPAAMPDATQQASSANDAADDWEALAREEEGQDTPVVDSPSISAGWPAEGAQAGGKNDWTSAARQDADNDEETPITTHRQRLGRLIRLPSPPRIPFMPSFGLPTACTAMGALMLALMIWRTDVVRLLPQTATFYKMVGLEVNLRGLAFKDIKITNETVDGKPVLVIEGAIVGQSRKPGRIAAAALFVRDAQGAEIYAWNAVLEQPVLNPGERA